ncbi:MAG: DUF3137 domain-containing protein [Prolixibacteraceae bacterium]|nr:DUF3137 domain-containing protein [Prolixibacteraceae bacterium]MBN2648431.1 DUF3137 domain-containing protein [Prolixibacteraceae bacterium]
MIKKEELQSLYNNELKDKLAGLEVLRKSVAKRTLGGIALIALPIIIGIAVFVYLDSNNSVSMDGLVKVLPFIVIALVITGIVLLILNIKKKKEYRRRYKNEVVSEVVRAIDSEWNYAPEDCISQSEYYSSDLFRKNFDRYKGDDLISGTIEKTDFRCSELHTEYKEVTHDKDGKRQEHWVTIFKGLFFHADFNKEIRANTYIEPDTAEKLLGKFGQKFQMSSKGKLVKLENIEFEKIFAVFSTDQTEARYILTPAIMEALVNIYKQYKRRMHLSFIGSRVYVAMSFKKDLFEPKIFSSGVKYEDVEFMYNLFMVNATIIHELNLNTRIWTKE